MCEHTFAYIIAGPNTMNLTDTLHQPDRDKFLEAVHKELSDHITCNQWKVIPTKHVSPHKKRLPMVWSIKRRRNPIGEIIRWIARLCAGGHRSIEFVDYWDTYSPVVS